MRRLHAPYDDQHYHRIDYHGVYHCIYLVEFNDREYHGFYVLLINDRFNDYSQHDGFHYDRKYHKYHDRIEFNDRQYHDRLIIFIHFHHDGIDYHGVHDRQHQHYDRLHHDRIV